MPSELPCVLFAFVFKDGGHGLRLSGSSFSMVAPLFPLSLPASVYISDHMHLALFIPVYVFVFLGVSV